TGRARRHGAGARRRARDPRCGRGARPEAGDACDRRRQVDVGDGRAVRLLALVALAACVAAGTASAAGRTTLTVYAAASLTDALPAIDHAERYSFAGSNTLAAQITQGAPADVFASANLSLPEQLYAKGMLTRVYVLTRNSLVL